jgi:hypothetical protein
MADGTGRGTSSQKRRGLISAIAELTEQLKRGPQPPIVNFSLIGVSLVSKGLTTFFELLHLTPIILLMVTLGAVVWFLKRRDGRLPWICPRCSRDNSAGALTCVRCGHHDPT